MEADSSATATVRINVVDVNDPPAFPESSYTRSVDENSTPGTNVGGRIVSIDPDDGDVLRYALSGTGSGLFTVSSATGQISVASGSDARP